MTGMYTIESFGPLSSNTSNSSHRALLTNTDITDTPIDATRARFGEHNSLGFNGRQTAMNLSNVTSRMKNTDIVCAEIERNSYKGTTIASLPERFQPFDLLKLPEKGKGIKDGKRVRFEKKDYKYI